MCVCASLIVVNTALSFHHKIIISCIMYLTHIHYLLSIWVISSPLFLATIVLCYIGGHVWGKSKDWNCITIWPIVNQHFLHIPQFWHSQSERCKCAHEMEQHPDLARRADIEVIFSQNSLLFALCIRHEIKNHQSYVSRTKFKFSCMHLQLCLWETSR